MLRSGFGEVDEPFGGVPCKRGRMRSSRFFGLTLHQLGRMAACWRIQCQRREPFTADDASEVCDIERTQAVRFLREMIRFNLLVVVNGGTRKRCFSVTPRWLLICRKLERLNRLPGVCCKCGEPSVPFPFCGHFLCENCLMGAHRNDFKPSKKKRKRYSVTTVISLQAVVMESSFKPAASSVEKVNLCDGVQTQKEFPFAGCCEPERSGIGHGRR